MKRVPVNMMVIGMTMAFKVIACGGVAGDQNGTSTVTGTNDNNGGGSIASNAGGTVGSSSDTAGSDNNSTSGGSAGTGGDPVIGMGADNTAGNASGTAGSDNNSTSGGSAGTGGASTGAGTGGASTGVVVGPSGFHHPGILNNRTELDYIKKQVTAGANPWKTSFDRMKSSSYASLSYVAHPVSTVGCGAYSSPDIGCSDEKKDVVAAYTHALLWYLTGNEANAKKAIEIMNAWSAVLKSHDLANTPLQSAWVGSTWPKAAEIIRYTYMGWATADIQQFINMLKTAYVPYMTSRWCHNVENWELSFTDALTQISVFTDDRALFTSTLDWWREWVHAAFYLMSDGPTPYYPSMRCKGSNWDWFGQTKYGDGICEETCRDMGHTQYGLAAMINVAETAFQQGVDLYKEEATRITTTYEFHAGLLTGQPKPSWLCSVDKDLHPTWEIGYNHYHNRLGMSLPFTKTLINQIRPNGTSRRDADHHMVWESLTHAELGNMGFP